LPSLAVAASRLRGRTLRVLKIIPTTKDMYTTHRPNPGGRNPIPKPQTPTLRQQRPSEAERACSRIPGQKTGRLLRATANRLVCQGQTSGFPDPAFGARYASSGSLSASRLRPSPTAPRSLRAQRSRHRQSAVSRPLLCAPFTRKRASRIFRRQPNGSGGCRSKNVLTGTVSQSEGLRL